MPTKSKKQERFMQAAAHNKEFADKAGISQKTAREFVDENKNKRKIAKINKGRKNHG